MPTPPRIASALAVPVLLVAVATACTPADGAGFSPTPQPTAPATSAKSTPPTTPTPSPTSSEEAEKGDAEQAVVAFWKLTDKLQSDPNQSLSKLVKVARGESASNWRQVITYMRKEQYTQVGSTVIRSVSATKKGKRSWDATACIDVSKVNVVDKKGKSVVRAGRPPRVEYDYVIERDGDKFYVVEDQAVGECA